MSAHRRRASPSVPRCQIDPICNVHLISVVGLVAEQIGGYRATYLGWAATVRDASRSSHSAVANTTEVPSGRACQQWMLGASVVRYSGSESEIRRGVSTVRSE
jgi:hypothetical protein